MPLVLDLRIAHDRMGSSADPSLNGHLKYPNNLDQSLNDAVADKIRKYCADYNNMAPSPVSFIPSIASTSGRLHSEFVRLLFLQSHRETDRFFAASGVQFAQTNPGGQFHFRRAAFLTQLKRKVGLSLAKAAALRINLNLDGAPIASKSHTHPSHSQTSHLLTSSSSLGVPVPHLLVYSLPLHRHSYIGFILAFASSIHNKLFGNQQTPQFVYFFFGPSTFVSLHLPTRPTSTQLTSNVFTTISCLIRQNTKVQIFRSSTSCRSTPIIYL